MCVKFDAYPYWTNDSYPPLIHNSSPAPPIKNPDAIPAGPIYLQRTRNSPFAKIRVEIPSCLYRAFTIVHLSSVVRRRLLHRNAQQRPRNLKIHRLGRGGARRKLAREHLEHAPFQIKRTFARVTVQDQVGIV